MKETNLAEENLKLPYISSNGKIPVILALDIGGTHIRVCRVEGGEIVQTFRHSSVRSDSHAEPADAMMEILKSAANNDLAMIDAIGIVTAGPVDIKTGLISNPFTLPGWSGQNWIRTVQKRLNIPIAVENDAMGAAFGELIAGAGRGADVMCMVTLGTGIGVAVISVERGPYRGSDGFHPEGGHIAIGGSVTTCYCGLVGCWEEQCNGLGIRTYWTHNSGAIDWQGYGEAVARALRSLSRIFGPDRFVIGGGVSANFENFAPPLEAEFSNFDPMGIPQPVQIRQAALELPGIVGANYLATQLLIEKEHDEE